MSGEIKITEGHETEDSIKSFYTEDHAKVWSLIKELTAQNETQPKTFLLDGLGFESEDGLNLQVRATLTESLEDQPVLSRAFSGERSAIEAVSDDDPLRVEDVQVHQLPPEPLGLDPAEFIAAMQIHQIGRPSSYAKHHERMGDYKERGWTEPAPGGRLTLGEEGERLLRLLEEDGTFPLDLEAHQAFLELMDEVSEEKVSAAQAWQTLLERYSLDSSEA